jgi:hypothetical protein
MANKPKTYVAFELRGKSGSGATEIWEVVTVADWRALGVIKWMAPWRQYCFYPDCETIYNPDCLKEIGDWCRQLTNLHKGKAE